jgi:putative ABC transport system substrate-binding protein
VAAAPHGLLGFTCSPSALNGLQRKLIADFTLANRLPAIFGKKCFVSAGSLMSYLTDWSDLERLSAVHVNQILNGANPPTLPVEQPTKFELVINLKTARALGITLPKDMLQRADELIQ